MIEETDTDIEVRKYDEAEAARMIGFEPYPNLTPKPSPNMAAASIAPPPTNDIDQYFADLGSIVYDGVVGPTAGVRQGAQELIDSGIDFLGSEASKFFQHGGFHKTLGLSDEVGAEIYKNMELNTRQNLNDRGFDTELPLKNLQPKTEIGIGIREMTAYVSNFLLGRPQFTKVKGLGDSVLDTIGDWGYRLLSNVRANSLGAHALNPEESNLSQLAVELGFTQELNDYFAEGSTADRMSESVADRIAMTANPSVRGMELDAEQRLLRKVDTIVEDNAAAGVITAGIMAAAKAFKTALAFPKATGAVAGGMAMAPDDAEPAPLSAAGRAARTTMSTADDMGGAAKVAPAPDLDNLGFFSQAERAAYSLGMDSGTGEQFLSMLKKAGVKEDELKWTGLDQILAKPRVTKEEIINQIDANRVELRETELVEPTGASDPSNPDGIAQFTSDPDIYDEPDAYEYRTEDWIDDMNRIDPDNPESIEDEFWWEPFQAALMEESGGGYDGLENATRILDRIKKTGYDSLAGLDRREADDALIAVAREEYLAGEPYILTTDIGGEYEIFGNSDIGFRVQYIGDGSYRMVREDAPSYNEAMVAAEIDALDYGLVSVGSEAEGAAQWSEYTQPGGSNYREILLSVDNFDGDPDRLTIGLTDLEQQEILALRNKRAGMELTLDERRRLTDLAEKSNVGDRKRMELKTFRGGHYEQEDLVVHARVSDRKDTSENKVLYIEELQSDWAQRGRRDGFFRPSRDASVVMSERSQADDDFLEVLGKQLNIDFDPEGAAIPYPSETTKRVQLAVQWFAENTDEMIGDPGRGMRNTLQIEMAKRVIRDYPDTPAADAAQKLLDLTKELKGVEGIVKGPFVDSTDKWVTVAMKRILQKAITNGYDYVAWTPGSVQVDRWGEQGLLTAYDKVIPKNSQKLVDRIDKGTKLEVIQIDMLNDSGSTFRASIPPQAQDTLAIPITDAMRNQAPGGMPLFSGAGAAVVGGAAAVSQNQNEQRQMEMQF